MAVVVLAGSRCIAERNSMVGSKVINIVAAMEERGSLVCSCLTLSHAGMVRVIRVPERGLSTRKGVVTVPGDEAIREWRVEYQGRILFLMWMDNAVRRRELTEATLGVLKHQSSNQPINV